MSIETNSKVIFYQFINKVTYGFMNNLTLTIIN